VCSSVTQFQVSPINTRWPRWLLFGSLILVFCTGARAQGHPHDLWPDSEATPDSPLDSRHEIRRPVGPGNAGPGEQVVTANTLRAPAKAQAAFQRAMAAFNKHQQSEAEKQVSRALEIYPDYSVALTLRAYLHVTTQRSDAVADLEHAIRADPSYAPANALLASFYNDSQRYDDASPLIQRALRLLPSTWQVHFEMARTLFGKHRSTEALAEVTDAITLIRASAVASPESRAYVHFLRGQILMDRHELEGARQEFELTLKEEPQGAFANYSNEILARFQSVGNR